MTEQEIEERFNKINEMDEYIHDVVVYYKVLIQDILVGMPERCTACGVDLSKQYEQVKDAQGKHVGIMEVKKKEVICEDCHKKHIIPVNEFAVCPNCDGEKKEQRQEADHDSCNDETLRSKREALRREIRKAIKEAMSGYRRKKK